MTMKTAAITRLRQKLAADKPVYGLWVTLESPSITEMAVGLAMAQQLVQQQGGILSGQGAAPPPAPSVSAPTAPTMPPDAAASASQSAFDLLSPAEAAKLLGVTEGDVLASLAAGDLKGKKIGSTYRIPRSAVEEFLRS